MSSEVRIKVCPHVLSNMSRQQVLNKFANMLVTHLLTSVSTRGWYNYLVACRQQWCGQDYLLASMLADHHNLTVWRKVAME